MKQVSKNEHYENLLKQIAATYQQGQQSATIAVNAHLVNTYWAIGQYIVEYEQGGKERAEYGNALIKNLSRDLVLNLGRGFSVSNLKRMRQFYLEYPKGATLSHLFYRTILVNYAELPHIFFTSSFKKVRSLLTS